MNNNPASFRVQAYALTDKGRRPNNEDFVNFFEPTDLQERQKSGCLYIVADGVGGASIGERASQYAAEKVLYEYFQRSDIPPGPRLKQVITHVNREIHKYSKDRGIRMATTLAVAVVQDRALLAANVGDSRIYLIRRDEVSQITQDHNLVGEMVRDGVISEAEALKNKAKNRLTRSIGGDEEVHVDIFGPIPLQPGDKIVLCSDGLTRYALKDDIATLTATGSAEQITQNLVAFAKERGRGGADNISVITVVYEPAADLEAILATPRPEAPEQPWELLETTVPTQPRSTRLLSKKWIVWSASGLGLFFIATMAILLAFLPDILPALGQDATQAPSITSSPPPSLTPTETPQATISATSSPSPTIEPTTLVAPPLPHVDCTKTIDRLNVRSSPSEGNDSKILDTFGCDEIVHLTGRYIPINNRNRDWYQISFMDENDNPMSAWVIANRISISEEEKEVMLLLDYFGMTLTPSPQPQQATATPEPTQSTTAGTCIYTVQANDNLSAIALKFEVADMSAITCSAGSAGCDLSNPDDIKVGWQLIIPGMTSDKCIHKGGNFFVN